MISVRRHRDLLRGEPFVEVLVGERCARFWLVTRSFWRLRPVYAEVYLGNFLLGFGPFRAMVFGRRAR